jgi:nitroreductase
MLNLSPDELLTTTRSVRLRLDFARPVDIDLVRECVQVAVQAPSGSNQQGWHFVVVGDADKKLALANIYRRAWAVYSRSVGSTEEERRAFASQNRVFRSADYLPQHIHEAPFLLIPCIQGRFENANALSMASGYGSILPATWSFMLAARARGLACCWTTLHLMFEQEAAEILEIPYESISQVAMLPVAYAIGTEFKPAPRKPLNDLLHIDHW